MDKAVKNFKEKKKTKSRRIKRPKVIKPDLKIDNRRKKFGKKLTVPEPQKPALNIKFIDYPSYKESRADTLAPMKKQRLTDMDDALQQKGPTVLLDKSMKQNYKTGGKVKLALKGGGRAYGRNS